MQTRFRGAAFAAVLIAVLLSAGCAGAPEYPDIDFRAEMRQFVDLIASTADHTAPGFIVVPQNGQELITLDGEHDGAISEAYVAAIDAIGREDLFYGYHDDDRLTPTSERAWIAGFLDRAVDAGVVVLVTDYCSTPSHVDDSYSQNEARGFVSFAANSRELDRIPSYPGSPHSESDSPITTIGEVQNFLYVLNPGEFGSRAAYLAALDATTYDLLIIDAFYEDSILTATEVDELQSKPGGARRLVIAYMSIGEAEDYRYYWQEQWRVGEPGWIADENPNWEGNYKVAYWEAEWQSIIATGSGSYLERIVDAGFDGVYLDIIDAFEYFE